jgi:hypothetical protein
MGAKKVAKDKYRILNYKIIMINELKKLVKGRIWIMNRGRNGPAA